MNTNNKVWLLPLLENSYEDVVTDIDRYLVDLKIDVNSTQFTLQEIVITALNSHSEHWIHCAVVWLIRGFPIDLNIINAIDELNNKKNGSQKDRQDAFKLARKWEQKNILNNEK